MMPEFLEDPSVLTKERLKSELLANNVALPSGEQRKDVYVQLYLKNLTVLNTHTHADTFSSDDERPTALVLSNRSRSGRKATRKSDKPRSEEVEVNNLSDEDLKLQLAKHGVDSGPIVASTRRVYEMKLQKLLDSPEAPPEDPADVTTLPKADGNHNGNSNSEQYSDKEDEEVTAPEPEPVPTVEKAVRSRGKSTPLTVRTSSRRQTKVVEEVVTEETPKKAPESVVEDILANEISTPTGMSATRRRPIRGAAGRPPKPSEYWLDESRLHPSVHMESRSEAVTWTSGASPASSAPVHRSLLSLLLKLLLLVVVAGSLFYAYQSLDSQRINALRGLAEEVLVPIEGAMQQAAAYLGLSSRGGGASDGTAK
ncbi:thymopoietin b [Gouania willdenowi]|uniref:Lamina-associated polypeptide 2, isoforms beta/gamma-like n=1 Tax=Gouania willdenowi TaxID=441366 RepID=A0A8C5DW64_GOUWI|nr:lamina-associated polypeptide 2, isoforms beta/gamma-like [Gouania willdenowi]